ncbi:MAG: preprotein translocase subunit SecG [Clostridiales bacterium]|jgi:preprotein translocase subunit SecG|nr:preprotein translocase subunit SecG [Clostridiales bacterium]
MHTALMVILAIVSVLLTLVILLQESKSDGLSSSIAGGAEQLFGQKKSNAYESMLHKATVVLSVVFIVVSLAVVTLS